MLRRWTNMGEIGRGRVKYASAYEDICKKRKKVSEYEDVKTATTDAHRPVSPPPSYVTGTRLVKIKEGVDK
jgi:hypothetical protein